MRIMLVTAALLAATPAVAQVATPRQKPCSPDKTLVAQQPAAKARARKLGDLPPAVEMKALYNVVDGCPEPVVLRRGIGTTPSR